jgi:hypothetical protein
MLIKQFIKLLDSLKNDLIAERPNETLLIAKEALALIRRRIQTEGEDLNGSQLGHYSDMPLPAFYFDNKSINASGAKAVAAAKKKGVGLSYKDFRRANNLPTDKVTLTFSGAMWREMDVQLTENNPNKTTAVIEPRTARSRQVALYNSERYGNILGLSKDEIKTLRIANLNRIKKSLNKYLK